MYRFSCASSVQSQITDGLIPSRGDLLVEFGPHLLFPFFRFRLRPASRSGVTAVIFRALGTVCGVYCFFFFLFGRFGGLLRFFAFRLRLRSGCFFRADGLR